MPDRSYAVASDVLPKRPFWLTGTFNSMRLGAFALRYIMTNNRLDPAASNAPQNYKIGLRTSFARVCNNAVWSRPVGYDDAGWEVLAFTNNAIPIGSIGQTTLKATTGGWRDDLLIPGTQIDPRKFRIMGKDLGGRLLGADADYSQIAKTGIADNGSATQFGGGFRVNPSGSNDALYLDTTASALVDGDNHVRFTSFSAYLGRRITEVVGSFSFDYFNVKTSTGYPETYDQFIRPQGKLSLLYTQSNGIAAAANWTPILRDFKGLTRIADLSDMRDDDTGLNPPIGPGWLWAPVGYIHGFSSAVRFYARKGDDYCLVLMWTNEQVQTLLKAMQNQAPPKQRAGMQTAIDFFVTNPGKHFRAVVWNAARKGPDIYTDSVIGDALQAGADLGDVDAYKVSGRTLAEWRKACAGAAPSAIWLSIAEAGDQIPEAKLASDTDRTELKWVLPEPKQDGLVRVSDSVMAHLQAIRATANPPISTSPAAIAASLQAALDTRGKGESVVDDTAKLMPSNASHKVVIQPWTRLGDLWFQHHTSPGFKDIGVALVSAELEPFNEKFFP